MSLYSMEEICEECIWAMWHICEDCYKSSPSFCHCEIGEESDVSETTGSCDMKKNIILNKGG